MTPSPEPGHHDVAPLRLDTTGQFIGGPLVGPHDNRATDRSFMRRCLAMFARVGAN
jgi:hypothetical protein